jgi:hypothetical protein
VNDAEIQMSWVSIDRICRDKVRDDEGYRRRLAKIGRPLRSDATAMSDEQLLAKLNGFGLNLDRDSLASLCDGAFAAEEVVKPILLERGLLDDQQADWIWICVTELWKRWWPDKVCLELLDDKMQDGYSAERGGDLIECATHWLAAWNDVLYLCDAAGLRSVREFDKRFPLSQYLSNWVQDLEMELGNAGNRDSRFYETRIGICEEYLRRFGDEDDGNTQNFRRALAESHCELGDTQLTDKLYDTWLAADPVWGWGWIGWADCYTPWDGRKGDCARAEELLLRGWSTPGVTDRVYIAERLELLYEEMGRLDEAREWAQVSRDERDKGTRHAAPAAKARVTRDPNVRRNDPCPCGSGRKYKRCCGSPR